MAIIVYIKKKPPRQLISEAIRHYNVTNDKTKAGKYWIDENNRDKSFLLRIVHNYVRHQLTVFSGIVPGQKTNYDDALNHLRNTGEYSYRLYNRIKRAVNNAIARQYSDLESILCRKCNNLNRRAS